MQSIKNAYQMYCISYNSNTVHYNGYSGCGVLSLSSSHVWVGTWRKSRCWRKHLQDIASSSSFTHQHFRHFWSGHRKDIRLVKIFSNDSQILLSDGYQQVWHRQLWGMFLPHPPISSNLFFSLTLELHIVWQWFCEVISSNIKQPVTSAPLLDTWIHFLSFCSMNYFHFI